MKFYFCQNDRNEITLAMSFKRTCALIAISNESALIHFALGNFFTWKSNAGLKLHFGENDRYEIHTGLHLISPQFMRTQLKKWLSTEVRFSTEIKSYTSLSSFRLSCEGTLNIKMENMLQRFSCISFLFKPPWWDCKWIHSKSEWQNNYQQQMRKTNRH